MKDTQKAGGYSQKNIEIAYQRLQRAKAFAQQAQFSEAEKEYKQIVLEYPNYFAARRALAALYIKQNKNVLAG